MIRPLGFALALLIAGSASPAKAGATTNVKCAPNEDRVWVYESLDDFNVAAKLKCGDPVQVVGRVKGYVKIATADGTEGYVLASALPKSVLPPEPEEKPNTVEAASAAFAARRTARSATPAASAAPSAASAAPTSAPTAPVAVASRTAPAAPAAPVKAAPAPPQPEVAMAEPAPSSPSFAASPATVENESNSEPTPPQPAPAAPAVSAKYSNPQPVAPSRAKKHESAPPAPIESPAAQPQPIVVATTASAAPAPPANNPAPVATAPVSSEAAAQASPMVARNQEATENPAIAENSATLEPVSSPADPPAVVHAKPPVNPDGDEDTAVQQLAEDTSNCALYFSAYGLSPNQYKWLALNRRKAFPSVCPAPTPAMVDFVVIFTHDVAFYNVTMPDAVHIEQNGFSDWTPLSTVDTALMTPSEADKSHHEYVWVFHTTRGAFDPSKFSSHRRPLYSKSETNTLGSRGGFRTVMDALTFIEQNATNR